MDSWESWDICMCMNQIEFYESNIAIWIKNQPTVDFTVTAHHTEKKKHATHRRVTIMVAVNVGAAESSKICGKFQRKSWEERHGLY